MRSFTRLAPIAALFLPVALLAQGKADPSGHWEGTVKAAEAELTIEVDLTKGANGVFAGTFHQPSEGVKGLPLSSVTVEGRTVRFVVKGGDNVSTFEGALSDDGKTITGSVSQTAGSVPFSLTRTGDARVVQVPKSAPVGKEFEGTWNGALDLGVRQMRVIVKMTNQRDGTATGTVVTPDGSGVEIPIAIKQSGANLTLDVPSIGANYVGALNAAGEIVGTWTQGPSGVPLTLKRDPATIKK
jgi:hypothetical protein